MQCDICSTPGQGTVVKAGDMSDAVRKGFNPFKCGLVPAGMAALAGPGYADKWARDAIDGPTSHSDWNICGSCMPKLKPYLQGFGSSGQSQCFIATATMGCDNAWEVLSLCRYRDEVLKSHRVGSMIIHIYQTMSPPLARFIAPRGWLRKVVRRTVVKPLALVASRCLAQKGNG